MSEKELKVKRYNRDFPGGPVVKTLPSNTWEVGPILGLEAKILHPSWPKKKKSEQNIKQKHYCGLLKNRYNRSSFSLIFFLEKSWESHSTFWKHPRWPLIHGQWSKYPPCHLSLLSSLSFQVFLCHQCLVLWTFLSFIINTFWSCPYEFCARWKEMRLQSKG